MFSNHEILDLTDEEKKDAVALQRSMQNAASVPCANHRDHSYEAFCMQCNVGVYLVSYCPRFHCVKYVLIWSTRIM